MNQDNFTLIRDVVGYLALVVGAVLILKSKIKTDNLRDLQTRVEILEKEREDARTQHLENQKAISNLEGQLATYKEIPLTSIAKSLEVLPRIAESSDKILGRLDRSASIVEQASHDGGLLVKTKKSNPLSVEVRE